MVTPNISVSAHGQIGDCGSHRPCKIAFSMETSGETAGGLCDFLQSGELGAGPQARWLATPASADRLAVSGNGRNDLDCRQDDAVHPTPPDG
jgi:hypothetical protein